MVSVWLIVFVLFVVLLAAGLVFILILRPNNSYPNLPDARCGNIITTVPLTGSTFRIRNVNTTTELWWSYQNNSVVFVEDSASATQVTYDSKGQLLVGIDGENGVYIESVNGSLVYTSNPTSPNSVWFFQKGEIHSSDDVYLLGIDTNARLFLVNRNRATPTECGFRIVTTST